MSETSFFIKGLYLVATPIGNLGDISSRALDILSKADLIACEDTRNSAKLFSLLGITHPPLTPYHEHNADKVRSQLLKRLKKGETIALISDAGTPLISDPGYRLVQDCIAEAIYVTAVPGPSAVLTALQLSGLPCHRFLFEGFLPSKTTARKKELSLLANIPATLIFYESPQRLEECLSDMLAVFGNRQATVIREMTKKFEQTIRGSFEELVSYYQENGQPKGELVVVVGPPLEKSFDENDLAEQLKSALQTMTVKDAAAFVSQQTGVSKKQLYQQALALKDETK